MSVGLNMLGSQHMPTMSHDLKSGYHTSVDNVAFGVVKSKEYHHFTKMINVFAVCACFYLL